MYKTRYHFWIPVDEFSYFLVIGNQHSVGNHTLDCRYVQKFVPQRPELMWTRSVARPAGAPFARDHAAAGRPGRRRHRAPGRGLCRSHQAEPERRSRHMRRESEPAAPPHNQSNKGTVAHGTPRARSGRLAAVPVTHGHQGKQDKDAPDQCHQQHHQPEGLHGGRVLHCNRRGRREGSAGDGMGKGHGPRRQVQSPRTEDHWERVATDDGPFGRDPLRTV